MEGLLNSLEQLYNSDEYPFHMPGHKRMGEGVIGPSEQIDITEIIGYDNLYEASGILKEAMDYAANLYKCPNTYYLVNGSTVGLLTAIHGVIPKGARVLLASNCHRSVVNGSKLRELKIDTVIPEQIKEFGIDGGVSVELIKQRLKLASVGEQYAAVIITSPTYEGVVSDIKSIADCCHEYGVPLIVDEAHGAHFSLDKRLPEGAIAAGADVVIHSAHKMLACLTQTALLHVQGNLVDRDSMEYYLSLFQTSSPSYLLMSSIDNALRELGAKGEELWDEYFINRSLFMECSEELNCIRILDSECVNQYSDSQALDPCKLVISVRDQRITGEELQVYILEKYSIQVEMAGKDYILALSTYRDSQEGFVRLKQAIVEVDQLLFDRKYDDIKRVYRDRMSKEAKIKNRELFAPCIPGR